MPPENYPHNEQTERLVLGACLLDPTALAEVIDAGLTATHFWRDDHGELWSMLVDRAGRGEPTDMASIAMLAGRSTAGGAAYVVEITKHVTATVNAAYLASEVIKDATRRQLLERLEAVRDRASKGVDDPRELLDELAGLADIGPAQADGWSSLADVARAEVTKTEEALDRPEMEFGLSTGLWELDDILAGLHPNDLVIVAGRPAMGKTSLVMQVAEHVAATEHRPVAVFSLEMSKAQLAHRLLAAAADVSGRKFRRGGWTWDEYGKLQDAAEAATPDWSHLHIDDSTGLTVSQIRARATRLKRQLGDLALVVVDYLQLLSAEGKIPSRDAQVSAMSRGLKKLAGDLDVPVLVLSQLNRDCEKRQDKRPQSSDLRESGAIEQDADAVVMVYRGEVYYPDDHDLDGKAELIVTKGRHGGTGTVHCQFDAHRTRFRQDSVIALD